MRITWVTRSFLDYRVPVYKALDELCGHQLTLIYNGDVVPERCNLKIREVLRERAIPLSGEIRLCGVAHDNASFANKGLRIPFQRGLIKAIRDSKPEVIVTDGFFQWTYAALWIRIFNLKKIKHVMCYERTRHTERKAGLIRTAYRKFVSRWIDAIDCNGCLTVDYVTGVLKYSKHVSTGHMAADTDGIVDRVANVTSKHVDEFEKRLNIKGMTFLYLGQIIPRKGVMELLRAWQKAHLNNATLLLVGDGSQKQEAENFVSTNSLEDSVLFTGSINYDNLAPYFKISDCFIMPTLEDNWSLVVPEAMAAGLPIACSIYNGCYPELVQHKNGWLFNPLDETNTIETLREIYASGHKFEEMGAESKRIILQYSPMSAAGSIFDTCLRVLKI